LILNKRLLKFYSIDLDKNCKVLISKIDFMKTTNKKKKNNIQSITVFGFTDG